MRVGVGGEGGNQTAANCHSPSASSFLWGKSFFWNVHVKKGKTIRLKPRLKKKGKFVSETKKRLENSE
jgi:hypothetical protein